MEGRRFEDEGGAGVKHWQRWASDGPGESVEYKSWRSLKEEGTVLVGVRRPEEAGMVQEERLQG